MGPKSKKPSGSDKQKRGEEEREEAFQAVVLTDSFETQFNPFTLEKPRCLLPLANTPLIEYTFEFLANAAVEELFVYCGAHTDQVEDYIQRSKWSSESSPFSKLEIIRSTSRSIGDAMRDLDKRAIMSGDFLIVYGDVVSNVPLEAALAEHRARRSADNNAIMTMVLREVGVTHRTKSRSNLPVFVIDPTKNRCVHYEQIHGHQSRKYINVDPDLLSSHHELDIREDLLDCGIDICSPDVLALWSDNFDYEAPRRGFLHSVLKDYELNGKMIFTHVVREHYAARVRNLQAYDSVSRDVVSRWAYPLCPDSNLLQGQSYCLYKGNIYKEDNVALARSCVLKSKTVLGRGTSIGDGSVISNSIIGRDCIIGKNVTIDGTYLWDNAVVGDGSTVTQAIMANEAIVGKKCTVQPGALISYGVRVSDGTTISGKRRITRVKRKGYDDGEMIRGMPDFSVVGEGGDGFDFSASDDEDEDEVEGLGSLESLYKISDFALSADSISTLNSDAPSDHPVDHHDRSAAGSFISIASDDSHPNHHATDFHHDAAASILDSLQKGDDPTNIQLELTALRMSSNASEHQVRRAVVAAFVKRISQLNETGSSGIKASVHEVFSRYATLIDKTIYDKEKSGKVDQVDFLLLLQTDLCHRKDGEKILPFMAMELYDKDVIEESGFVQWWSDVKSSEGEEMQRVGSGMQGFVDALAEAEEDETSEEDDSGSEEE